MQTLAAPASWPDTARWLGAAGVAQPRWIILSAQQSAAEACAALPALTFPLAVKALPEHAEHKTELGLLALNVASPAQVEHEAARIRSALGMADAGVLVQEMAGQGVEVLLAAVRNPDFGPVLALGLGGIAIELFGDVAWLALPTNEAAVRDAISRLRLATMLAGFRGRPAADLDALVRSTVAFGDAFIATRPMPAEFEINPLIVLPAGQGVLAVDALIQP